MDDRIFVLDLLPVKLKSAVCNIESTQNSSKVNDTFSGLTKYQSVSKYNASELLVLGLMIPHSMIEGLKLVYPSLPHGSMRVKPGRFLFL